MVSLNMGHPMHSPAFIGVLFTGKGKPVLGDNDIPLEAKDGKTRLGRGYSESTFRKYFHALNTLHKHFQRESTIGVRTTFAMRQYLVI